MAVVVMESGSEYRIRLVIKNVVEVARMVVIRVMVVGGLVNSGGECSACT